MKKPGKLHIMMGIFSFEMQCFIDDYMDNTISFDQLNDTYFQMKSEGHELKNYKGVLESLKKNQKKVKLWCGNLPRPFAIQAMLCPLEGVLQQAKQRGYVAQDERCIAKPDHFDSYLSIATGKEYPDKTQKVKPEER